MELTREQKALLRCALDDVYILGEPCNDCAMRECCNEDECRKMAEELFKMLGGGIRVEQRDAAAEKPWCADKPWECHYYCSNLHDENDRIKAENARLRDALKGKEAKQDA